MKENPHENAEKLDSLGKSIFNTIGSLFKVILPKIEKTLNDANNKLQVNIDNSSKLK